MRQRRIYVASSWRNLEQPFVVEMLRDEGHQVYDFRNPAEGDHGFHWSEIDIDYEGWTATEYTEALCHEHAVDGFGKDMAAMEWADTFVLVLPCGRSAHLELGWAVGSGRETHIVLDDHELVPELMYKMVDKIHTDVFDLPAALR